MKEKLQNTGQTVFTNFDLSMLRGYFHYFQRAKWIIQF